jgi:hypothetical protein
MADVKISALTAATTPLAGTEVLPIVQSGVTVKVAVSNLTAGRAVALGATTITGALSVSGITTVAAGSAALPAIVSTTGTADTGLWFPAADTVAASTAGTERMRIDSSGNVGIGTNSPSTFGKLAVVGGNAYADGGYFAKNSSATSDTILKMPLTVSTLFLRPNGDNTVEFFNDVYGSALTIKQTNVGIGTTSPTSPLVVKGTSAASNDGSGVGGVLRLSTGTGLGTDDSLMFGVYDANYSWIQASKPGASTRNLVLQQSGGNVGIGTSSPSYQLQVNTDSAAKPGVGGLWTVVSDERIKSDIVPANLDRCYEIVKSVPLKHFGFAPGVYTDNQIQDKHNLGWIAQDVQKVFKNAVSVKPFTLKTDIPDGVEEYEEQDFTTETVEKTETNIQVVNGKAVQVSKVVISENKVMLFDTVDVLDEAGAVVMDGDKTLTYQMPRMITKTRPKVRHDVIEDCLDLNSGQMIAALYGCVQALMAKVEALEAKA